MRDGPPFTTTLVAIMTTALEPQFEEGLHLIRLRRRRMLYVFVGFIPFMLVAAYVVQWFSTSEMPLMYLAFGYMGLVAVYALRLAFTECPRCGGLYHWNWWSNPWTRKCLNCGLPLKALTDGN